MIVNESPNAIAPLTGVLVADLSATAPGPYCTSLLARLGARVIKFEPAEGDIVRSFPHIYDSLNRGKESVVVDLKKEEDVSFVQAAAERADILVEGWRPGVADRLGLGAEGLWQVNPKLIYCSITGYGREGQLRDRAGHDLNYVAASGLNQLLFGKASPQALGFPLADLAGGTFAALRILAALAAARVGTVRQLLDVSIAGAVRDWVEVVDSDGSEQSFERILQLPHYGVFETADGHYLTLGIVHESKFWTNLLSVLGCDDWSTESFLNGGADPAEVRSGIAKLIRERSRADLESALGDTDTCWAFADPPSSIGDIGGMIPTLDGDVAALGEHSRSVREEFLSHRS